MGAVPDTGDTVIDFFFSSCICGAYILVKTGDK